MNVVLHWAPHYDPRHDSRWRKDRPTPLIISWPMCTCMFPLLKCTTVGRKGSGSGQRLGVGGGSMGLSCSGRCHACHRASHLPIRYKLFQSIIPYTIRVHTCRKRKSLLHHLFGNCTLFSEIKAGRFQQCSLRTVYQPCTPILDLIPPPNQSAASVAQSGNATVQGRNVMR